MSPEIRIATSDDAPEMGDIYRPIVLGTPISFELEPPDPREMARRIEETIATHPWLVCALDGEVAGYAYACRHRLRAAYRWSVDTTVYVRPDCHRLGVARGLYTSLFAVLSAQGYFNAYAGISLPNPGSVSFHEALGFQPVGVYRHVGFKQGAWHDVGWWQRVVRDPGPAPMPPLTLDEVRSDARWPEMLKAGVPCIRSRSVAKEKTS